MSEIAACMKNYFYIDKKNPKAIGDLDETNCWLCEKYFESTKRCRSLEETGTQI